MMNRRTYASLRMGALAMLLGVASVSCQKDNTLVSPESTPSGARVGQKTIAEIVSENGVYASLRAAVTVTGLAPVLADPNANFTVFAPGNDAFSELPVPFNNPGNISRITDPGQLNTLRSILLYHVLGTEVFSGAIPDGSTPVETAKPRGSRNDNTIYLSRALGQIRVNGVSQVVTADIDASNGVIHRVNRVLRFPSSTIAELVVGSPNLSTLLAALVKTDLAGVFTGEGDFTVFAPTNAAFARLPAPFNNADNISAITDPAQISALSNILRYHVLAKRAFLPDLGLSSTHTTLADGGATVMTNISLFSVSRVKGNGNASPSTIVPGNVFATNGVVHIIDQVLLP